MIHKIWEFIKLNMKINLTYVAAAWSAFVTTFFQIIVFYYIWMAVYKFDSLINGISKEQIITYIIISRIIYIQTTWGFIEKIGRTIQTGSISMELLRPIDYMCQTIFGRIGDFFAFAIMTAVPTLIVCSLTIGFHAPKDFPTFIYFIISFVIAMGIAFLFEFLVGILTFYTNYSWGLQSFQEAFLALFSGALVPISFFPGWLKAITNCLPFQQMSYSPVSIYLGIAKGAEIYHVILFQIFWLIVMFMITRTFYNFAIKRVTVQGG